MKKILIIMLALISSGCAWWPFDGPEITDNKLPYWLNLNARTTDELDMIVIHATELTDMAEARKYGERVLYEERGTGASGHYYIDRDGSIVQYVPDNRIANHTSGWNSKTLSIELINKGRYPNWYHSDQQVMQEPYADAQIDALIILVNELKSRYPSITYIQGHENLDMRKIPAENDSTKQVRRKMDPGPYFPWTRLIEETNLKKQTPSKG